MSPLPLTVIMPGGVYLPDSPVSPAPGLLICENQACSTWNVGQEPR